MLRWRLLTPALNAIAGTSLVDLVRQLASSSRLVRHLDQNFLCAPKLKLLLEFMSSPIILVRVLVRGCGVSHWVILHISLLRITFF